MKNKTTLLTATRNGVRRIFTGIACAITMTLLAYEATAIPTVDLGTASGFSILAGSKISDAGGASTISGGNVGLYPASGAAIGLTPAQVVGGTIYVAETSGALLNTAQNDLTTAYVDAAGRPATVDFGVVDNQLGGRTLFPGVYRFGHAATANLIGTLTLDANGELDPIWIFQATSDLITASGGADAAGSNVALINGATSCDVFWQVGSSATLGTYSAFAGNILADQSIALNAYATLDGSALSRIAAVTLDHNTISDLGCADTGGGENSVPDAGSLLPLLAFGLVALLAFDRRNFLPLHSL